MRVLRRSRTRNGLHGAFSEARTHTYKRWGNPCRKREPRSALARSFGESNVAAFLAQILAEILAKILSYSTPGRPLTRAATRRPPPRVDAEHRFAAPLAASSGRGEPSAKFPYNSLKRRLVEWPRTGANGVRTKKGSPLSSSD